MGLFILQETPVGYALFKAKSSKKSKTDSLEIEDDSVEAVCSRLKLKEFHKFDSAATALEQAAALTEAKVTPRLSSLLDTLKDETKASLAVADRNLANAIERLPQFDLKIVHDSSTTDMYRAIRSHLSSLIPSLTEASMNTMSLGLSHSLSRHHLKFSTDKVDTMIVQAIALLDDLDKELNMYAMRVKEWYGWHFPEMAKIVNDNLAFARIIVAMGMRTNAASTDLSEILPEEIEGAVKAAAEISMGTEITSEDLENIQALAEQVVSFTEYRSQLSNYLASRMAAIAPNLTALVGELVGARLIAHAGSLRTLSKNPASTIQILGAEKALFRALKTKHDTPKYGLIYHASLVGQATGKNKGKIARVLAAKAALGVRIDANADWSQEGEGKGDHIADEERSAFGIDGRLRIERRLAALEGKPLKPRGVAIAPNGMSHQPGKWEVKEARKYNRDADGLLGDEPAAAGDEDVRETKMIEDISEDIAATNKSIHELAEDAMDEDVEGHGHDDDSGSKSLKEISTSKTNGDTSKRDHKKHLNTKDKESQHEKLAASMGISLKKFRKKLDRGEIVIDANGDAQSAKKKRDVEKDPNGSVSTTPKESSIPNPEGSKKRKRTAEDSDKTIPVVTSTATITTSTVQPDADADDKAERKRKKKEAKKAAKAAAAAAVAAS